MSVATLPRANRSTNERAMAAAKAAIAQIPRHQETKYTARVSAPGTLLGVHLDTPPTQHRPPVTTELRYKAGAYSMTDLFAGCGGSSLGAIWAGIGPITAYNHWPEAVACHAVNIGGTHFVADLNLLSDLVGQGVTAVNDPHHAELFGYSDILWNSAPCPPWSGAKTKGKESKADTRSAYQKAEALKKARGSMYTGLDYAYAHRPLAAITENVPELLWKWEGMRGWLATWEDYGYVTTAHYVNSAFVGPLDERTPQWRDRVYFTHILKQYADNFDTTLTVEAECLSCRKQVQGVQTWKNGRTSGKYRTQYIYTCPSCHEPLTPPTRGLETAIDLSDLGTPIAERSLGLTTLTRIQNGLNNLIEQGLPAQPLIVTQDRSNQPEIKPARPWTMTGQTLTARQVLGVVTHPALLSGDTRPARSLPTAQECNFRMATGRELSSIAGFPTDYLWVGSKRDVSMATGNAVSPRVGQHFVERVVAALP
jgi:site-specific DNA-cytosine methylase